MKQTIIKRLNLWQNGDNKMYKIVRMYFEGGRRTITKGLTLEEAQAHCQDTETSSSTCTNYAGRQRTKNMGAWFDGYEEQ